MLFYPAALPLSSPTLKYTASLIRRHRARIGSPWRKLNPAQQALLVLAYLRKGRDVRGPGRGVRDRHRHRLAVCDRDGGAAGRRSPRLRAALAQARRAGHAYLIISAAAASFTAGGVAGAAAQARPITMADVAVRIRYMRLCPKVARRIQDTLLSPLHVLPSTGGYVTGRRADGSVLRLPAQDPVLLTCHYPRSSAVRSGHSGTTDCAGQER